MHSRTIPIPTLTKRLAKQFSIKTTLLFSFFFLLLTACSDQESPEQVVEEKIAPPYILKGDLNEIVEKGTIRLLAPRTDESEALPRDEISIQAYRRQAEEFAESLNLESKWIYTDRYDDLLVLLNEGKGDLIVTNLSVTDKRKEQVSFTRPLISVNEQLVVLKTKAVDLESGFLTIAVRDGTSYLETANRLAAKNPNIKVVTLDPTVSNEKLMSKLSSGEFDATILDSNIANYTIDEWPNLVLGETVKKNRQLAWAVRQESPGLQQQINEFLLSQSIQDSRNSDQKRNWQTILKSGELRVISLNNPASYFIWKGELMGFDYVLMEKFAEQNKLKLHMVIKESPEEMIEALKSGEGDVIAGALTKTQQRQALGIEFSKPYLKISEQLIAKSKPKAESLQDLTGLEIDVNPNSSFYQTLKRIQNQNIEFKINQQEGAGSEKLIADLIENKILYTVADSHRVSIEQTYMDDLSIIFDLNDKNEIAWGLRPEQKQLKKKLDQFIKKEYRGLYYNMMYNRYFVKKKHIKKYQQQRLEPGRSISPYDELFKQYALKFNRDWRLLVSQAYQESQFDPKARSFAGAQGLMQLMPRTAKSYGYTKLDDPETNIKAALEFMQWLEQRFPQDLPLDEKIFFTLAAYNAGHGHVNDARSLARKLGKNPDKWFGEVEEAMLLLSKKEYYRKARYGYVRGQEPVNYVREIRDRYLAYVDSDAGN